MDLLIHPCIHQSICLSPVSIAMLQRPPFARTVRERMQSTFQNHRFPPSSRDFRTVSSACIYIYQRIVHFRIPLHSNRHIYYIYICSVYCVCTHTLLSVWISLWTIHRRTGTFQKCSHRRCLIGRVPSARSWYIDIQNQHSSNLRRGADVFKRWNLISKRVRADVWMGWGVNSWLWKGQSLPLAIFTWFRFTWSKSIRKKK